MMEYSNMQPQEESEYVDNPILTIDDHIDNVLDAKQKAESYQQLVSDCEGRLKDHPDFDTSTFKELYGDKLTIRETHQTSEPLTIKELEDANVDSSVYIDKWQLAPDAEANAIIEVAETYGECVTIKIDHKSAKEIVSEKDLIRCRNLVEAHMEVVLTGSDVKSLLNSTEGLPSEIYSKLNFGKQSTISFSKIRSNK